MASLSSLVVDLQVESAKLRKGLDDANAQLTRFAKQAEKNSRRAAEGFDQVNGKLASFGSAVKGLGAAAAAYASLDAVFGIVKQSVGDFVEATQATQKLSAAVASMGYNVDSVVPALSAQADQFERVSLLTAEQVQEVQQLLLRYGVAPSAIQSTTAAVLDYAAATGKNAREATQTLMQGVESGTDGIRSMGIEFDATGDKTKDLSKAVDALGKMYGGAAKSQTEGFAGQVHQLQVEQGKLSEAFGEFIATLNAKTGLMEKASRTIIGLRMALFGDEAIDKRQSAQEKVIALQEKELAINRELEEAKKRFYAVNGTAELARTTNNTSLEGQLFARYQDLIDQADAATKARLAAQAEVAKLDALARGEVTAGGDKKTGNGPKPTRTSVGRSGPSLADAFAKNADELEKESQAAFDKLAAMAADLQEKVGTFGLGTLDEMRARFDTGDLAELLEKAGPAADGLREKILDLVKALEDLRKEQDEQRRREREAEEGRKNAAAGKAARASLADSGAISMGRGQGMVSLATGGKTLSQIDADQAAARAEWQAKFDGANEFGKSMMLVQKWMADNIPPKVQLLAEDFASAAKVVGGALLDAAYGFVSSLGGVGDVANAAIQGAQNGGIWGAFIAALLELFKKFEGFSELMDLGEGSLDSHIKVLSDVFRQLVDALKPLMAAISTLINTVLQLLTPIIEALVGILRPLANIIMLIAFMLKGLQPVFDALGKVIQGIVWVLDKVLWAVFQVLRGVGFAILGIIYGVEKAWNGIISAVQWVFRQLGGIELFGVKPLEFLEGWADGLENAKANTDAITGAMGDLAAMSWDAVAAAEDKTAADLEAAGASKKMADAANDVTAALRNVPDGFKAERARFHAMASAIMDASGLRRTTEIGGYSTSGTFLDRIPHFAAGGIVDKPTVALIGEAGPEAVVPLGKGLGGGISIGQIIIQGVRDGEEAFREFKRRLELERFQRTGSPAGAF